MSLARKFPTSKETVRATPGDTKVVQAMAEALPVRVPLVPLPGCSHHSTSASGAVTAPGPGVGEPGSAAGCDSLRPAPADDPGAGVAFTARCSMTTIYWDAGHDPVRPSWDCASCDRPWPCEPAREHLAAHLGNVALAVHMWNRFEEAAIDMWHAPFEEVFERFIGWTRRP